MEVIPPLYIPYSPDPYTYDNYPDPSTSWISYPMRSGWCPPETLESKLHQMLEPALSRDPAQTASFFQSWLYFGLLAVLIEEPVNPADFLDKEDHGRIDHGLATAAIRAWKQRVGALSESVKAEIAKRHHDMLWTASVIMRTALDRERGIIGRTASGELNEVIHGIMILGAEILRARGSLGVVPNAAANAVGRSRFVHAQLVQAGWCPGEIERWESRLSPASLGWAGKLLVKEKGDDRHKDCDVHECLALQINEASYVTKHDKGCNGCGEFVSVDTKQLEMIVAADGTPLVQVSTDAQGNEPVLKLLASEPDMHYVAISHVWADGLGNVKENSLPRCQLRRLQSFVNDLYSSTERHDVVPFFIDTLCIPVNRTNGLRRHAISRMLYTYSNCDKVLVLDESLLSCPAPSSLLELLMRFIQSHWLQRLWTLLEAALTSSRNLRFADRAIDICASKLNLNVIGEEWNEPIPGDLLNNFFNFTGMARRPEAPLIQHVFNSMQPRSTSHSRDEFIVAVSMLAFKPEVIREFLDIEEEEGRWKALVDALEWWPPEFLFLDGPRMEEPGYRWCVKSFLCRDKITGKRVPRERAGAMWLPLGKKVDLGLVVRGLWGFHVRLVEKAPVASLFHAIHLTDDAEVEAVYLVRSEMNEWTDMAFHTLKAPAIVTMNRPLTTKHVYGAVVDIESIDEDGNLYARWIGAVDVSVAGPNSMKIPDNIAGETEAICIPISDEQIWCIG